VKSRGPSIEPCTHELFSEVTLMSVLNDLEFTYQRNSAASQPETFTFRVLGLHNIREARVGEIVRVNARGTNFDVKPCEILHWMEEYGKLIGEFRYSLSASVNSYLYIKSHSYLLDNLRTVVRSRGSILLTPIQSVDLGDWRSTQRLLISLSSTHKRTVVHCGVNQISPFFVQSY